MTKKYFLEKAYKLYGDLFDYSLITNEEIKSRDKIKVICKKHGIFTIIVNNFLNGRGCYKCKAEKKNKAKTENFIEKAKKVHGDKYDYSKVNYVKAKAKVCIICPEHGEFWQTPDAHLRGQKCPKCTHRSYAYTKDEFIEQSKKIHGDKYDYSKVNYVNSKTKVCIICPEHGEFMQRPSEHLRGKGCPKCGAKNIWKKRHKKTLEEFKNEMIKKFGDIYDFSEVKWVNCHTKIVLYNKITNKKILQTPSKFLNIDKPISYERVKCKEDFINKAKKVHGDKYDYSKVVYVNSQTKVCIICPEHGEFWQTPNDHLDGCGCPQCNSSKLENQTKIALIKNNINFKYQYYPSYLSNGFSHQSFDFYLPDYNIAIECQGEQHFKSVKKFGGKDNLKETIKRDIKKNKNSKAKIIYLLNSRTSKKSIINNKTYMNIYTKDNVYKNLKDLINNLKN